MRIDQLGARIERMQDAPEFGERFGIDEIRLVDHDHIAELDLRDQHFHDRAVMFIAGSSLARPRSLSASVDA